VDRTWITSDCMFVCLCVCVFVCVVQHEDTTFRNRVNRLSSGLGLGTVGKGDGRGLDVHVISHATAGNVEMMIAMGKIMNMKKGNAVVVRKNWFLVLKNRYLYSVKSLCHRLLSHDFIYAYSFEMREKDVTSNSFFFFLSIRVLSLNRLLSFSLHFWQE
jgi:hypothetical protein